MHDEPISTTIVKTERPNSYECGKAGNRFKIYFDSADDLLQQLNALTEKGFVISTE